MLVSLQAASKEMYSSLLRSRAHKVCIPLVEVVVARTNKHRSIDARNSAALARMDSDDSADDDRCEMCGVDPTTRASNLTKRTLMTNAPTGQRCGHRFCGACVERGSQASKGQGSFPCPALGCGAPVRRATLDPRRLDAIEVARDASARARTLAVHNKPRDAFATRRDYDDYLEERENVVHALTSGRRRRCLLYTSPSPRDATLSRMPSSA